MNKDNKNTELDNTDKKLHISVVMSCYIPTIQYLEDNIKILNNNLEKLYTIK